MDKKFQTGPWCSVRMALAAAAAFVSVVAPAAAFDPLAGDFSKADPRNIRVMEYNHEGNFISDPATDAAFARILVAIDPDIIAFEEFPSSVSANAITLRLNQLLPGPTSWQVHLGLVAGTRNVIASRYPLSMQRTDTTPASSTRGVTIALVNLPDADFGMDLYLMGVHLKCCGEAGGTEDASRQRSADAIANWLADARGVARPSGNQVVLPAGTPMIVLGDFNMVGGPQPELTFLTGDIQQESLFGPDAKGDWDNSNVTNLNPLDPFTGDSFTWQSNGQYPSSALDRMFFTDSMLTVASSFVLNTATMTPSARAAAGLQATDTARGFTSDHLPIVMDIQAPPPVGDGDFEPDGDVDLADFAAFQRCFGSSATACAAGNLVGPGTPVDASDYALWSSTLTGPATAP